MVNEPCLNGPDLNGEPPADNSDHPVQCTSAPHSGPHSLQMRPTQPTVRPTLRLALLLPELQDFRVELFEPPQLVLRQHPHPHPRVGTFPNGRANGCDICVWPLKPTPHQAATRCRSICGNPFCPQTDDAVQFVATHFAHKLRSTLTRDLVAFTQRSASIGADRTNHVVLLSASSHRRQPATPAEFSDMYNGKPHSQNMHNRKGHNLPGDFCHPHRSCQTNCDPSSNPIRAVWFLHGHRHKAL